jgi:predicted AAA+ superfamily ATPase
MKRILYENIWKMLSAHKQMVFIAGPRQAGKTTFTQILAEDFNNSFYFNWDILPAAAGWICIKREGIH